MHLALLIVGKRILLQHSLNALVGDDDRVILSRLGDQLEDVKQLARIAARVAQHGACFFQFDVFLTEYYIFRDGMLKYRLKGLLI